MLAYYIQINLVCIIIILIVSFLRQHREGFNSSSQLAFTSLVLSAVAVCFSDIFCWIFNGNDSPALIVLLYLLNMIYFMSITLVSYYWLNYVYESILGAEYSRKKRILSIIPLIIMAIAIIITPFTKWVFYIDENNKYQRGTGIILHWIISWGYLFYCTIFTLRKMKNAKTHSEKNKCQRMMWFIIMPAISAIIQMLSFGVTATGCGITISIVMLSFGDMQEQIYSDSLTGLNNRRALERYIDNTVVPTGTWISVLMCDIDKFKLINDTYGHLAGDMALKRLSSELKSVVGKANSRLFLCRYGGDEFVICGTNIIDDFTLPELVDTINSELEQMGSDSPDEIPIKISIGIAEKRCTKYSEVEELIRRADESMYNEKESRTKR